MSPSCVCPLLAHTVTSATEAEFIQVRSSGRHHDLGRGLTTPQFCDVFFKFDSRGLFRSSSYGWWHRVLSMPPKFNEPHRTSFKGSTSFDSLRQPRNRCQFWHSERSDNVWCFDKRNLWIAPGNGACATTGGVSSAWEDGQSGQF